MVRKRRSPAGQNGTPPAKAVELQLAVELGASHIQLFRKDRQWEPVTFDGPGTDDVGGRNAIPTITAVRLEGDKLVYKHGHDAVYVATTDPSWMVFVHLKAIISQVGETDKVDDDLKEQEDKAKRLGTDTEEIATQFFSHVLHQLESNEDNVRWTVYVNIVDTWSNKTAQRLLDRFGAILPNARFYGVNECICSLAGSIARLPHATGKTKKKVTYVVADLGHHTIEVGDAQIGSGWFHIRNYRGYRYGADLINRAVAVKVRELYNEEIALEQLVWQICEHINKSFKPSGDPNTPSPLRLDKEKWGTIMKVAVETNDFLDENRVRLIRQAVQQARTKNVRIVRLILTGAAARSKTFQEKVMRMVDQDENLMLVRNEDKEKKTAVVAGLQRMADDERALVVKHAPMSLFFRNNPDYAGSKMQTTVIRVLRTRQDLTGQKRSGDRHPLWPVHYQLDKPEEGGYEFDLSVYGTPSGKSDRDIIEGTDGGFDYANPDQAEKLSEYTHKFPMDLPLQNEKHCHVYVYVTMTRVSATIYAVFKKSGIELRSLEQTSVKDVIVDGKIVDGKIVDGKIVDGKIVDESGELMMVHLGHVMRPQVLQLDQDDHSAGPANEEEERLVTEEEEEEEEKEEPTEHDEEVPTDEEEPATDGEDMNGGHSSPPGHEAENSNSTVPTGHKRPATESGNGQSKRSRLPTDAADQDKGSSAKPRRRGRPPKNATAPFKRPRKK